MNLSARADCPTIQTTAVWLTPRYVTIEENCPAPGCGAALLLDEQTGERYCSYCDGWRHFADGCRPPASDVLPAAR